MEEEEIMKVLLNRDFNETKEEIGGLAMETMIAGINSFENILAILNHYRLGKLGLCDRDKAELLEKLKVKLQRDSYHCNKVQWSLESGAKCNECIKSCKSGLDRSNEPASWTLKIIGEHEISEEYKKLSNILK